MRGEERGERGERQRFFSLPSSLSPLPSSLFYFAFKCSM
jgi:hypothetical protein